MNGKTVVTVVDDDRAVLRTLSRMLGVLGMDVETYESPVTFLAEYKDKPGCILLDLSMPLMNGLEVQSELIKRNIETPVIFVSGHGEVLESVRAVSADKTESLEKPIVPDKLIKRIEAALVRDAKIRSRVT